MYRFPVSRPDGSLLELPVRTMAFIHVHRLIMTIIMFFFIFTWVHIVLLLSYLVDMHYNKTLYMGVNQKSEDIQ